MKNFKTTTLLLTVVLTLALVVPMMIPFENNVTTTSAASNKDKIKSTVNNYFKATKSFNVLKMSKCTNGYNDEDIMLFKAISPLGSYIKKRNKSMSYTIKQVKTKGSTATVTVKCKYLDSSGTYSILFSDLFDFILENYDADYSEEDLIWIMKALFKESLKNIDNKYNQKFVNKTIKINLIKQKGSWKINTDNYDLSNVVTSNFFKASKDLDIFN